MPLAHIARTLRTSLVIPWLVAACILGATLACASCDATDQSNSSSSVPQPDGGGTTGFDAGPGPTAGDAGGPTALQPCPVPSGAGLEHKTEVTGDEKWTLADSPHRVTTSIRIVATVTVEPCAVVLLSEGSGITVGNTNKPGALVAHGERGVDASGAPARRPVTFAAADPSKPWGSLTVNLASKLDLATAILTDGADPSSDQNGGGVVVAYGDSTNPPPLTKSVRAVDVTVKTSRGMAFNFQRTSGFSDDSGEVTVQASGRAASPYPVRLEPGAIGTLPTVTLDGNVANEILVAASNVAMSSDTFKARGVPYRLGGRLRVAPAVDGPASTLTIEAGVTIRMDKASDSGIQMGSTDKRRGVLVAVGTADKPITFTSPKDAPQPADWNNVFFGYSPQTGNRIDHAIIEYAGGFSGAQGFGCGPISNDASVLLLGGRPDDAFIQNTTIRHGGGDTGILLGWASDQAGPDFVSTNTFVDVPACKVSRWKNVTGTACPGSVAGSPVCLP